MFLIDLVHYIVVAYTMMIFARLISSWIPEFQGHPIMRWISQYTDPYLNFFRRFIPPLGVIDLSPIVAFIALRFMEGAIIRFIIMIYPH